MSTENRAPGAPGEGVSDAQVRLERYAILMTFDDDAKIPGPQLMEQWQVNRQTVAAVVSGAKRMTPDGDVAKVLTAAGYRVAELPKWFGEAARAGAEGADADVQVVPDVHQDVQDVQVVHVGAEGADEMVYEARTPLSIAQVQPGDYLQAQASAQTPPASSTRVQTPPAQAQTPPAQAQTPPARGR